jgi:hypothetical protein
VFAGNIGLVSSYTNGNTRYSVTVLIPVHQLDSVESSYGENDVLNQGITATFGISFGIGDTPPAAPDAPPDELDPPKPAPATGAP